MSLCPGLRKLISFSGLSENSHEYTTRGAVTETEVMIGSDVGDCSEVGL